MKFAASLFTTFLAASLFTTFLAAIQVSALALQPAAIAKRELEVRATATCPDPTLTVPLQRAYSSLGGDHFYSTSTLDIQFALAIGYTYEGVAALIFPTQEAGTTTLFRLFNSNIVDHFYTTSTTERDTFLGNGYVLETNAGFIYTSQICGSVPLFRLYNLVETDHFYTISAAERDNAISTLGYSDQGIAGYVIA